MADLAAPMEGEKCSALPFAEEHRAALRAACAEDPELWPIYALSFDPEHFDASLDHWLARPDMHVFVLFEGDEVAGMSSFLAIDQERGALEMGGSYYRPHFRGTGFNWRVKDMFLRRAFGCGFRRVEFRVDSRNKRSLAAMAKIGGVCEAILRAERITWTGHVRDTVLFSILKDEWPNATSLRRRVGPDMSLPPPDEPSKSR
ncbi:GNAT family protein [Sphingomonas sp. LHG3406-1]|uniref:GNAT family N-acetyltransferase n=1 Tax=Sphingomonas sp. LHG3406-1 TaxID=2804617 RepID=UPI0026109A45|nr:GNAT family protein [Sphingomonas sp. LHG3406-1]